MIRLYFLDFFLTLMIPDLSQFSGILFWTPHCWHFYIADSRQNLPLQITAMSSAYAYAYASSSVSMNPMRSWIYMLNRIGLSIPPCMTPLLIGIGSVFTSTLVYIDDYINFTELITGSLMPKSFIFSKSMAWSTLSNAALRSIKRI